MFWIEDTGFTKISNRVSCLQFFMQVIRLLLFLDYRHILMGLQSWEFAGEILTGMPLPLNTYLVMLALSIPSEI